MDTRGPAWSKRQSRKCLQGLHKGQKPAGNGGGRKLRSGRSAWCRRRRRWKGREAKPLRGKGGRKLDTRGPAWSKRQSRKCLQGLHKGQKTPPGMVVGGSYDLDGARRRWSTASKEASGSAWWTRSSDRHHALRPDRSLPGPPPFPAASVPCVALAGTSGTVSCPMPDLAYPTSCLPSLGAVLLPAPSTAASVGYCKALASCPALHPYRQVSPLTPPCLPAFQSSTTHSRPLCRRPQRGACFQASP